MNEFLVLLQAKLDEAKSKGLINSDIASLQSRLDKLKLQVELDPNTAQKLANDIGKLINQQITISNINIDTNQAVRNAQQTGQRIGKQIQNGINSVIQKGNFTTEFTFSADKRNNVAKVAQKEFQEIANGIVTVKEQMTQVNGTSFLDGFIVNIKKANGEVESLTYRLKDMLDSQGKVTGKSFQYIGGSINDNGVLKQFDAISTKADNLQTKLDKLKAGYSDINSSRPIKDSNNISALSQQYDKVSQAIENVRNADNTTFSSMVSNAQREITALESMVAQFRNAENVATQMKSVDISSGIAQAQERLGKLKADSTGFEQMTQTLRELDTAITNVGDKSSLDAFIDKLRVAETQLSRVKAETKSMAQVNKIQLSMETGGYESKVESLIARTRQWTDSEGQARINTAALSDALTKLTQASEAYANNKSEATQKRLIESSKQLDTEYQKITNDVRKMNAEMAKDSAISSLHNQVNDFMRKNGKAVKYSGEFMRIFNETAQGAKLTREEIAKLNQEFNNAVVQARNAGKLGKTFFQTLREGMSSFSYWTSSTFLVMQGINKTKQAFSELKEINSIMTEISKVSQMTSKELQQLGNDAFESASKYGKTASDYLTGIQDFSRAGFRGDHADQMAELSVLAQAAGDMSAELSNKYLIATDAAYKLNGEASKLNEILDGQNYIANNNATSMEHLADATRVAASQAASAGVAVEEMSAAIGTMVSVTQDSGETAGRAFKAILMNLQQVSGELDNGEVIDEESLTKYEKACNELGVSLKTVKDGVVNLREPMEILKELSDVYTSLDKMDARRANLISAIGGKHRGNQLNALLENWQMYEKMLVDYSNGSGSAMREAMKSASNWEGSLNRLKNTWTDTVQHIANSDDVIQIINGFNGIVSVLDKVTGKLGTFGSIGLGAGIFAGWKNVGELKIREFYLLMFC